jgi:hypothetical protein
MKKFLAAIALLAASFAPAQTFDSQAAAAQAAVQQLQGAAEAKVAADASAITSLTSTNSALSSQNSSLSQQNAALGSQVTSLAAQIQTLQSTFTWRDMEWVTWKINCAAQVGGSGNGIGTQVTAPGAQFAIAPTPPPLGASNYFDCYYTWDAAPDESKTHFRFTQPWAFPAQADANASQALEMEVRQVLPGGMMGVWAVQMNFAGKQLRIFDHVKKWFATGTVQPRLTPGVTYAVTLDGHRDGTNVCYDSITINTASTPLTYCYPMWDENWRPMMRVAAQLDGNGSGTAYSVKRDKTTFSSW